MSYYVLTRTTYNIDIPDSGSRLLEKVSLAVREPGQVSVTSTLNASSLAGASSAVFGDVWCLILVAIQTRVQPLP